MCGTSHINVWVGLLYVNSEPRLRCQPDRALATLCIDSNIFNQLNINHDGAVAVSKMITCDGHLLLCLTAHIVP